MLCQLVDIFYSDTLYFIGSNEMLVNVSQLLKEPVGSSRKLTIDERVGPEKGFGEFYVKGNIVLTRIDKGVLATGEFHTNVTSTCGRCLKEVNYPFKFVIEEVFLPSIDINSGLPVHVKRDAFVIDEHHNLDLSDALYQNALLALPMRILCKDDCGGICPVCGKNLNESKCNCKMEKFDQRWSVLQRLKKEESENGTTT
jgi:uncharacterized protein